MSQWVKKPVDPFDRKKSSSENVMMNVSMFFVVFLIISLFLAALATPIKWTEYNGNAYHFVTMKKNFRSHADAGQLTLSCIAAETSRLLAELESLNQISAVRCPGGTALSLHFC